MLKQVSLGRPSALLFGVVFVAALAITAFVPASGRAVVNIEGVTPQARPNYDSRSSAAPTADALAAAQSLGADVTWNRFGVASSVSNEGHFVGTGLQAPDAASPTARAAHARAGAST